MKKLTLRVMQLCKLLEVCTFPSGYAGKKIFVFCEVCQFFTNKCDRYILKKALGL